MGTKLDKKWAQGIRDNVNALILEVERLEGVVETLDYRLQLATTALENIVKKVPEKLSREEAADMAVEFKQLVESALQQILAAREF